MYLWPWQPLLATGNKNCKISTSAMLTYFYNDGKIYYVQKRATV